MPTFTIIWVLQGSYHYDDSDGDGFYRAGLLNIETFAERDDALKRRAELEAGHIYDSDLILRDLVLLVDGVPIDEVTDKELVSEIEVKFAGFQEIARDDAHAKRQLEVLRRAEAAEARARAIAAQRRAEDLRQLQELQRKLGLG